MGKMSEKAEETLYRIMRDIRKLKRYGVEVHAVTVSPQLATYKEEKEIARILGLSTTEWCGDVESYVLKTDAHKSKH